MESAPEILASLDATYATAGFPMLDNGYVYLAATRLALFRPSDAPNTHWRQRPDGGSR